MSNQDERTPIIERRDNLLNAVGRDVVQLDRTVRFMDNILDFVNTSVKLNIELAVLTAKYEAGKIHRNDFTRQRERISMDRWDSLKLCYNSVLELNEICHNFKIEPFYDGHKMCPDDVSDFARQYATACFKNAVKELEEHSRCGTTS